jgi:hypothetical protein
MGLALYAAEMRKFYPGYELTKQEVHEMFKEFMGGIDDARAFYMHMDAVRVPNSARARTHTKRERQRVTQLARV